jgi:hypothetical protein
MTVIYDCYRDILNNYFAVDKSADINLLLSCNLSFCKYFSGFPDLDVGNFDLSRSFNVHDSILRHYHTVFTDYDLVLTIVNLLNFYVSHVSYLSAAILDYIFAYVQYFDILDSIFQSYFAGINNKFNFNIYASDFVQFNAIDNYAISNHLLPLYVSAESLNETLQTLCDVSNTIVN